MCRLEMHGTRSVPTTMAGFQTHITVSTLAGVGYGVWGYSCGAPVQTCVLAGGLCSVSGMLPDLDSESGRPVQEISCFAAAVVPLLMLERFREFGWSQETMAFVGAIVSSDALAQDTGTMIPPTVPPAPVGHAQPTTRAFSPNSAEDEIEQRRLSTFDAEQRKRDEALDKTLNICGCSP